ncbi:MoaD/ThiS family protein [Nakamurella antarctica]|uniref:MoaD/ThiS family protein n=1 Tax=Nakamurella antarctica TaxID=1902245 RepID=A0A3G8ZKE9_9ACTN|nr:MoaD/ThiS family protein [Nakamurella antarctica]AZI57257.1 MoaD/ThiS family protein [Nakamurella antarctica]
MTAATADVKVLIRYFAAARAAVGFDEEYVVVHAPFTVETALAVAVRRHGLDLKEVLTRCSFLLDEVAVHGVTSPVFDGQAIDVLPPFAGG